VWRTAGFDRLLLAAKALCLCPADLFHSWPSMVDEAAPMSKFAFVLHQLPFKLRRITSSKTYSPEIDGLRFFAIGLVVLGHLVERIQRIDIPIGPTANVLHFLRPGIGVTLFFSISGFIIASQFLKRGANSLAPLSLKAYFTRRISRIEPPYIIVLTCTFLFLELSGFKPPAVQHFDVVPQSLLKSFLASLLYMHGILFHTFPRLFGPGWSLEIEVQFYIMAPILFFGYFAISHLPHRILAGCAIIAAFCLIGPYFPVPFTLIEQFHFFWTGVVLADINLNFKRAMMRYPIGFASAGGWLGVALLVAAGPLESYPQVEPAARMISVTAIVLIFGGALIGPRFRSVCSFPWVSLIGGACYSIYLTHLQAIQMMTVLLHRVIYFPSVPIQLVANFLIQLPIVLAAGLLFYTFCERPFMVVGWPSFFVSWLGKLTGRATKMRSGADPSRTSGLRMSGAGPGLGDRSMSSIEQFDSSRLLPEIE
jgi:peptidoglycan/LPS O-acetylase OafA/YrhL